MPGFSASIFFAFPLVVSSPKILLQFCRKNENAHLLSLKICGVMQQQKSGEKLHALKPIYGRETIFMTEKHGIFWNRQTVGQTIEQNRKKTAKNSTFCKSISKSAVFRIFVQFRTLLGSCYEKISILLRFFSTDYQGPTKY